MINIALDLDGCIANFSEPFIAWVAKKYGVTMIPTNQFHWAAYPYIKPQMFEEFIAEFIRDGDPEIQPKQDGALLINYLWEEDPRPILFVTARHPSTAGATHNWIRKFFPQIDFMVAIVNSGSSKWRFLDQYDCFVEDRRKTCLDLASRGKTVFMPMRKYNSIKPGDYGRYDVLTPDQWKAFRPQYPTNYNYDGGRIYMLNSLSEITEGSFDRLIFK